MYQRLEFPIRDRLVITISETAAFLSIGRSTVYNLINEGKLLNVKIRKRSMITVESILALVERGGDHA